MILIRGSSKVGFLVDVAKKTRAQKSPIPQIMSNTILVACGSLLIAFWGQAFY